MNACVVCFSRTGNTKRFAQAIAQTANAPLYDLTTAPSSEVQTCDLLILGTPVEGASPAKETAAYIETMPTAQGKKLILFCTYKAFGNERTMKKIEKTLSGKGYTTVLKISKKGMKPEVEADFTEQLAEVKKALGKL
jgi:flavodoxin